MLEGEEGEPLCVPAQPYLLSAASRILNEVIQAAVEQGQPWWILRYPGTAERRLTAFFIGYRLSPCQRSLILRGLVPPPHYCKRLGLGSPSWDPLGPNRFTPLVKFWPGGGLSVGDRFCRLGTQPIKKIGPEELLFYFWFELSKNVLFFLCQTPF